MEGDDRIKMMPNLKNINLQERDRSSPIINFVNNSNRELLEHFQKLRLKFVFTKFLITWVCVEIVMFDSRMVI